jgi:hypothetical protein
MLKRLLLAALLLVAAPQALAASFTTGTIGLPSPLAANVPDVCFYATGTSTSWTPSQPWMVSNGTNLSGATLASFTYVSGTSTYLCVTPGTVTSGQTSGTLTVSDGTLTANVIIYPFVPLLPNGTDNFNRPNTTTGVAGSQTGLGNNHIDKTGGVWKILGQEGNSTGSGAFGNYANRPPSESFTNERWTVSKVLDQGGGTQDWGAIVGLQSDTSHYLLQTNSTTCRVNRVSNSGTVNNVLNALTAVTPVAGDSIGMDVTRVIVGGNALVIETCIDFTQNSYFTQSYNDSSVSKIVAAGMVGLDTSQAIATNFNQVVEWYSGSNTATLSPAAVQSTTTGTVVTMTCATCTYSGSTTLTMTASGSNGAAISNVTFVNANTMQFTLAAGTANDSLVITEGGTTNGTITNISVTAPVMNCIPLLLLTGSAANTLTCNGNVQTWLSSAPTLTSTGVSGCSIGSPTVVTNTQFTVNENCSGTGTTGGTLTISDTNSSYPTSTTVSVKFAVLFNATNVVCSPYNFHVTSTNAFETVNSGAYCKTNFTITNAGNPLIVYYDPSPNVAAGAATSIMPVIEGIIDPQTSGSTWVKIQETTNSNNAQFTASLASGTHEFDFYIPALENQSGGNRWNPPYGIARLLGLGVDPSATVNANTAYSCDTVIFGDSITAGSGTQGLASNVFNDNSNYGLAVAMAKALGCEYGIVGFPGQSLSTNETAIPAAWNTGNTPVSTVDNYYASYSRLVSGVLSPAPKYCLEVFGQNGLTNTADVTAFIGHLRTICGTAKIGVVVPPSNSALSNITTGFNNYVSANPGDKGVFLVNSNPSGALIPLAWLNNTAGGGSTGCTFDSLHPFVPCAAWLGSADASNFLSQVSTAAASGSGGNSLLIIRH